MTKQQDHHLFTKLSRAAERDSRAVLKAMPKEIKDRLAGVFVTFVDKPTPAMIERGNAPEALSVTDREAGAIIVFLMNLIERYGVERGGFWTSCESSCCGNWQNGWAGNG